MNFLKCISCKQNFIKVYSISSNGTAKTKCSNCGLTTDPVIEKKKPGPEIIYRPSNEIGEMGD